MRSWMLFLLAGCGGSDTGPIGGIDPSEPFVQRIDVTWEVYDSVGPTSCPDDHQVRASAGPDSTHLFPCEDMEGVAEPVPTGNYVVGLDLIDSEGRVVDSEAYGVFLEINGEDQAYALFLLP